MLFISRSDLFMKKIIICILFITLPALGIDIKKPYFWGIPAWIGLSSPQTLKPITEKLYSYWNFLSLDQQKFTLAAATCALVYFLWPVSQKTAREKAEKIFEQRKIEIENLSKKWHPGQIERHYMEKNNGMQDINYGSLCNPDKYSIIIGVRIIQDKPSSTISLYNWHKKTYEEIEFYDKSHSVWGKIIILPKE